MSIEKIERSQVTTLLTVSNENLDTAYENLKHQINSASISDSKRESLLNYLESCYTNRSIELLGGLNNESILNNIKNAS